ncbi:hypothetical protein M5K25_000613 [Dendrobium thyrsiflorum]|uniref:Bromo domain-containing protein n=1 Tax=Dendrobium thyrsiflorum TaxID=117978 RepID=A0ABD0VU97_DENTH
MRASSRVRKRAGVGAIARARGQARERGQSRGQLRRGYAGRLGQLQVVCAGRRRQQGRGRAAWAAWGIDSRVSREKERMLGSLSEKPFIMGWPLSSFLPAAVCKSTKQRSLRVLQRTRKVRKWPSLKHVKISRPPFVPYDIPKPYYVGSNQLPELSSEYQIHDDEGIAQIRATCDRAAHVLDFAGIMVKPSISTNEIDKASVENKSNEQAFKKCCVLISKLTKHNHSWVFNALVDANAFGLPDYHKIITNSMDLGTLKSHLSRNWYKATKELAEDVRLIFHNVMTCNPRPLQIFEERWPIIEVDLDYHYRYR